MVRQISGEVFEQRVEALIVTLKQQMVLYEAEQRTLQVLCGSSVQNGLSQSKKIIINI